MNNPTIDKEIEEMESKLYLLKKKREEINNPKYKSIVEWGDMPSFCEGIECRNCIFRPVDGYCLIGNISSMMTAAKNIIDNNGGYIEKIKE